MTTYPKRYSGDGTELLSLGRYTPSGNPAHRYIASDLLAPKNSVKFTYQPQSQPTTKPRTTAPSGPQVQNYLNNTKPQKTKFTYQPQPKPQTQTKPQPQLAQSAPQLQSQQYNSLLLDWLRQQLAQRKEIVQQLPVIMPNNQQQTPFKGAQRIADSTNFANSSSYQNFLGNISQNNRTNFLDRVYPYRRF